MKQSLSGILLCGGHSRRMGTDKATLCWMGQPMARHIIANLRGIDDLWLAVGSRRIEGLSAYRQVPDQFPDSGPLAGMHAGMAHCRHDMVFVTGCDLPFVDQDTVDFLWSRMRSGDDAVVPRDSGGRAHPLCAVYHRRIAARLEEKLCAGSFSIRSALCGLNIRYVAADTLPGGGKALTNLNTQDEYRNARGAAFAGHLNPMDK